MQICLPKQKVIDILTQDDMVDMELVSIVDFGLQSIITAPATQMGAVIDELVLAMGKEEVDELVS
jgi:hypothetical protein